MKTSRDDANRFLAKPDPRAAGALLYGMDAMRVALKRQDMLAAHLGPNAEEDMRLTRIPAAELRKEPALVIDALKAVGFFPGPRAVLVEEAADGLTPILKSALEAWADGDAMLVVTAGSLNARSSLRKLFTEHPSTKIIPIYDDPPSRATIEAELARAQLPLPDRETFQDLTTLAHAL
ncbi:MAG: DNA polymerase III subunit delta, partial [Pseudomonadota bacterium]